MTRLTEIDAASTFSFGAENAVVKTVGWPEYRSEFLGVLGGLVCDEAAETY